MKKVVISFFVLNVSFILGSKSVSANMNEVVYDLNNHKLVEKFQIEEDGELVDIIITDNSLFARMADKTYTVSKNKNNSWMISYKVSVKNNKITSAHSGSFTALQGNFSNTSVNRHSNSLAIGKGAWKYRAATKMIQVKASVVNNSLNVQ